MDKSQKATVNLSDQTIMGEIHPGQTVVCIHMMAAIMCGCEQQLVCSFPLMNNGVADVN